MQNTLTFKKIFFLNFGLSFWFLIFDFWFINYQLLFVIPGISPLLAISLKHILHKPKSLIKPLPRPHLKQRFTCLEENLGTRFDFSMSDFFAICFLSCLSADRLFF